MNILVFLFHKYDKLDSNYCFSSRTNTKIVKSVILGHQSRGKQNFLKNIQTLFFFSMYIKNFFFQNGTKVLKAHENSFFFKFFFSFFQAFLYFWHYLVPFTMLILWYAVKFHEMDDGRHGH